MVSKTIGLNRILKLADFVEQRPRARFDFSIIVGDDWKLDTNWSCGTSGCALGWATVMPLFRKLGLHIDEASRQVVLAESYSGYASWEDIGEQIFGVNLKVMYALFQPNDFGEYNNDYYDFEKEIRYPYLTEDATPKQWAKHARKIVKMLQAA